MTPLLLVLPGNEHLAAGLAAALEAEIASAEIRRFPDGETYVRIDTPVTGRPLILLAGLHHPDAHFLPLALAAETARDLGAASVGLIAPYLAFLRQDIRFRPGEGVTSRYFAAMLSRCVDWLVTVDPHLHRYRDLAEIYSVPARTLHAAGHVARWIRDNVARPLLVGPDAESEQWVAAVGDAIGAPHVVAAKNRLGDASVEITLPDLSPWSGFAPVVVDDVISSARTMAETVSALRGAGLDGAICVGVHGLFADGADAALMTAGAARVVTCNTVPHVTNEIDIAGLLADGASAMPPFAESRS